MDLHSAIRAPTPAPAPLPAPSRSRSLPPQVGGYGVWTAVPVLPDPYYQNATARNITLLVAQMDSNAMFHDLAKVRTCRPPGRGQGCGRSAGLLWWRH